MPRTSLQFRVFSLVAIIMSVTVIILSAYFLNFIRTRMIEEFKNRGTLIVNNFARNCMEGIMIEDAVMLNMSQKQLKEDGDVLYSFIYGTDGVTLNEKVYTAVNNVRYLPTDKMIVQNIKVGTGNSIAALDFVCPILNNRKQPFGEVRVGISLARITADSNKIIRDSLGLLFVIIMLGLLISYLFARTISAPIKAMISSIYNIVASKDLTHKITYDVNIKELVMLRDSFNLMLAKLDDFVTNIQDASFNDMQVMMSIINYMEESVKAGMSSAGEISGFAAQTDQTVTEVNDSALKVSSEVETAKQIIKEMVDALSHLAEKAYEVSQNTNETGSLALEGNNILLQADKSVNAMQSTILSTAAKLTELGKSSVHIGHVIGLVEDIATETNLLAINAAIEAAHQGEMGAGFAVVAEEIRNLATKSMKAIKEITPVIHTIQAEIKTAIESMEKGTAEIKHSTELNTGTRKAIKSILLAVQNNVEQVESITEVVEEMNASSEEVHSSVERIFYTVKNNSQITTDLTKKFASIIKYISNIKSISEKNTTIINQMKEKYEDIKNKIASAARNLR